MNAQYNGAHCPNCGSTSIEGRGSPTVADGGLIILRVDCNECAATWNELYKLIGCDDVSTPEPD